MKEIKIINKKQKRIKNINSCIFLHKFHNKKFHFNKKKYLSQLKKCAKNDIIDKEEVPKLETIRNWISRYASQHRQEAAMASKK